MLNKHTIFTALFWGLLATFTYILLIEVQPSPQTWPKDKLEHAVAFALLTYLGVKTYPHYVIYCCLGLAIYGGTMELLQSQFTQTRTGSLVDWLADLVGIAVILFVFNVRNKSVKYERV